MPLCILSVFCDKKYQFVNINVVAVIQIYLLKKCFELRLSQAYLHVSEYLLQLVNVEKSGVVCVCPLELYPKIL